MLFVGLKGLARVFFFGVFIGVAAVFVGQHYDVVAMLLAATGK